MARARKSALRVVATGEAVPAGEAAPAPKASASGPVARAAQNGTTRELLVAMRNRIARAVDNAETPPRDLAALTKRLADVVREIEAIDAREQQEEQSVAVRRDRDESFNAAAI